MRADMHVESILWKAYPIQGNVSYNGQTWVPDTNKL